MDDGVGLDSAGGGVSPGWTQTPEREFKIYMINLNVKEKWFSIVEKRSKDIGY